jgi:thioredoxin 2
MESVLACIARKERHRLRVMRVDVGEQQDLAARFRVNEVPTLVLVVGNRAVARLDGRVPGPQIEALLELHLAPAEVGA